jgi:hypothetical protein
MANTVELKRNLSEEDAQIFKAIEEAGWVLELESHKYHFVNYDSEPKEELDLIEDDEEAIHAARVLYEQITKQTAAHDANEEKTPATAAARHLKQAHEVDLRVGLIKLFEAERLQYKSDVECSEGTAEIVTEGIVFELLHAPSSEGVVKASERLKSYLAEGVCRSSLATATIVVCCAGENLEELQEFAEIHGVSVTTLERMNLSEPDESVSTPASGQLFAEEETAPSLRPQMHPARLERHPALLMRAAGLNDAHVADLEDTYRAGAEVEPLDVFHDGTRYLVADGNHRHEAATRAGVLVDVNIHKGDLKAALIFALKSNAQHGLKLSDDDKRLKALTLLSDHDWFKQSDSHLATIARGITQPFISKTRRDLGKLKSFLVEDEHKLSDEDMAASFDVPTGLVRMIRRLPTEERASLTQNILSDDRRRVGADNVVRTVPAKGAETEAPLFERGEQAEEEQQPGAVGKAKTLDDLREALRLEPHKLDEEALRERGFSKDIIMAANARDEFERDDAGYYFLKPEEETTVEAHGSSFRLVHLLLKHPDGLDTDEVLAQGFTMHDITSARTSGEIERHENGRCFYRWKAADIVSALKEHGQLSRLQLEEMGCQSYVIVAALGDGLITQPETGTFALPESSPDVPTTETATAVATQESASSPPPGYTQTRPSEQEAASTRAAKPEPPTGATIESRLKGKKAIIGITFIPGLKGKVQATVNIGDNAAKAARELFNTEELVLPPTIMRMIDAQIGTPKTTAPAKPTSSSITEQKGGSKKGTSESKVSRIVASIEAAKDMAAFEKVLSHNKLGIWPKPDLSRFSTGDAQTIRKALSTRAGVLKTAAKKSPATAAKKASKKAAAKKSSTKRASARA